MLKLNQPMPMCLALVKKIQAVTQIQCSDCSSVHPLLSLITQHVSGGKLDCADNRGIFVVSKGTFKLCVRKNNSRRLNCI